MGDRQKDMAARRDRTHDRIYRTDKIFMDTVEKMRGGPNRPVVIFQSHDKMDS